VLAPTVDRLNSLRNAVWGIAPQPSDAPLGGVGIGTGSVVGPARLVLQPEDIGRLQEGDVLVAIATTTAFNAVFPLVAGVITEQGGLLSHAAILARELDLPAVVGVAGACAQIPDGALVELDPATGTVRLLL
jgi:pyruvate,water dikinase